MHIHPFAAVCLAAGLVLLLQASASAADIATPAAAEKPLTHATEPLDDCMAKWDPGTHMTKEAWRQSCLRIKEEREKYVGEAKP